jgi:Flp pilus assembly protein TadG
MRRLHHPQRHPERGVVIIWTAFFLLFMLGFVAIGIDVAKLMATRTQLQNAADAAALAGASALDMTTGKVVQDTARIRAQAISALNKAFVDGPTAISLSTNDISFPANNRVKVTVRRDANSGGSMITHVAQVIGIKSMDVSATAVAIAESAGAVCEKLVPLGAIEPPAGGFKTGCANTYNLKIGSGGGGTPGNFQLLDFPPCNEGPCGGLNGGGAEIRCEVANGYSCCINIGDLIPTMPGNKVGPFMQGLNDRWDSDTDRREGICYTDYHGNGNRIVLVPMFNDWDPNGKKSVKVEGFSAFFLQKKPSGGGGSTLTGQFLYYVAPGGSGGKGNASTTLYSLRLIQ